jgi:hypothetical protein
MKEARRLMLIVVDFRFRVLTIHGGALSFTL